MEGVPDLTISHSLKSTNYRVALIAPEFIIVWAIRQRLVALKIGLSECFYFSLRI